jgi:ketopantoate reductase
VTLNQSASHINAAMKILCFGAGAIGTYIGGSLALAGSQVVFLERGDKVDQLREKGLRLDLTSDPRRKTKEASVVSPRSFVAASTLEATDRLIWHCLPSNHTIHNPRWTA